MFRELFIQTDADDLLAEEDRRRRVRRSSAAPPGSCRLAATAGDTRVGDELSADSGAG